MPLRGNQDNVKAAIDGENYENTKMYPDFLEEAKKECNQDAVRSFDWANRVEKVHEAHFRKALEVMGKGKDMEPKDITVCPVCGDTFIGDAPDTCPICHTPRDKFMKID